MGSKESPDEVKSLYARLVAENEQSLELLTKVSPSHFPAASDEVVILPPCALSDALTTLSQEKSKSAALANRVEELEVLGRCSSMALSSCEGRDIEWGPREATSHSG